MWPALATALLIIGVVLVLGLLVALFVTERNRTNITRAAMMKRLTGRT